MNDSADTENNVELDIEATPATETYRVYRKPLSDDDAIDLMFFDDQLYIGEDGRMFGIDPEASRDQAFDGMVYDARVYEIIGGEPVVNAYFWNEDDDDCKDRNVLYFGMDKSSRPNDAQIRGMTHLADLMKGPYAARVGLYLRGSSSSPLMKDISDVLTEDGMREVIESAYAQRLINEDSSQSPTELEVISTDFMCDVGEFCAEMGADYAFSDEGEEMLSASGNLRNGTLYTFDDVGGEREMSIYELASMIPYDSFSWTFPKKLLLKAFDDAYPEGMNDIRMCSDDFEPDRDMSRGFIEQLLSGDLMDQFYYDGGDSEYSHVDDIDDSVKSQLEEYGFPKDIYERIKANPDAEEFSDERHRALKGAYQCASEDALTRGAEDACMADFDSAIVSATPRGVDMIRKYDSCELAFDITREFVDAYADKIWETIANDAYSDEDYTDEDTLADAVPQALRDMFNSYFDFREPYYGWEGFDEETFNDSLRWRIDYALYQPESAKK